MRKVEVKLKNFENETVATVEADLIWEDEHSQKLINPVIIDGDVDLQYWHRDIEKNGSIFLLKEF